MWDADTDYRICLSGTISPFIICVMPRKVIVITEEKGVHFYFCSFYEQAINSAVLSGIEIVGIVEREIEINETKRCTQLDQDLLSMIKDNY